MCAVIKRLIGISFGNRRHHFYFSIFLGSRLIAAHSRVDIEANEALSRKGVIMLP